MEANQCASFQRHATQTTQHKCTTTAQQRIDANAAVGCPEGVSIQHTMQRYPRTLGSPGLFTSVDRTRTFRLHPMQWVSREGSVRSPCFPDRHPTIPQGVRPSNAVAACRQSGKPGLFASVDRTRTFRPTRYRVSREGSVRPQH
jgi:hypothetical protein